MKITYKSVTGEVTVVEVSEEIGSVNIESRRKERSHCYSLDAITCEGDEYADKHTADVDLLHKINNAHSDEMFSELTPTQQSRMIMYSECNSGGFLFSGYQNSRS